MKVVLLREVRTTVGVMSVGTQVPARASGDGGWIIELSLPAHNGRRRTTCVPGAAARPVVGIGWRVDAACGAADCDPEWWFQGGDDADKAKQRCNSCPVMVECATDALQSGETNGIRASIHCRSPHAAEALAHIAGTDLSLGKSSAQIQLEIRRGRVAGLTAAGLSAQEIAMHLNVSYRTIERDRAVLAS